MREIFSFIKKKKGMMTFLYLRCNENVILHITPGNVSGTKEKKKN